MKPLLDSIVTVIKFNLYYALPYTLIGMAVILIYVAIFKK